MIQDISGDRLASLEPLSAYAEVMQFMVDLLFFNQTARAGGNQFYGIAVPAGRHEDALASGDLAQACMRVLAQANLEK